MDERYLGVEAYSGDEEYIFISYKRESIGFIRHIISSTVEEMIKRGRVPNFWYDRAIEEGEEWEKTVLDRAAKAKCMIAFIDRMAFKSSHIRNELNEAFNKGVPIIAVYLENVEHELPAYFVYRLTDSDYGLNVNKLTQEALIDTLIRAVYNALDGIVGNKKETRSNTVDEYEDKLKSADYLINHYILNRTEKSYTQALNTYQELVIKRAFDPRPRMGLIKCAAASREAKTDETLNILADHWSYIDPSKKGECQQQYHDVIFSIINDEIASIESAYTNEANIKYRLTTATGETKIIDEIIGKLNALKGHKTLNESCLSDFKDHIDAVIAKHNRRKQQLSDAVEIERIESERQAAINREENRKKENRNKTGITVIFIGKIALFAIAVLTWFRTINAEEGTFIVTPITYVAVFIAVLVMVIYEGAYYLPRICGSIICTIVPIVFFLVLYGFLMTDPSAYNGYTLASTIAFLPAGATFSYSGLDAEGIESFGEAVIVCIFMFVAMAVGVAILSPYLLGSLLVLIVMGMITIYELHTLVHTHL